MFCWLILKKLSELKKIQQQLLSQASSTSCVEMDLLSFLNSNVNERIHLDIKIWTDFTEKHVTKY